MSAHPHEPMPPRDFPACVLLGSDLSPRSDRALDRAALLARGWGSELLVVHAIEGPMAPDQALAWAWGREPESVLQDTRRQLLADVGDLGVRTRLLAVRGEPGACIRDEAARAGCGLVVVGMARNEALGRFLLGSTAAALARSLEPPLLVVRQRARAAYRRVVVATDFSAPSREALLVALRWFPDAEISLFHALPDQGLGAPDAPLSPDVQQRVLQGEAADFLAGCGLAPDRQASLALTLVRGPVETRLSQHVRAHAIDLVVLGSLGRSGVSRWLLGSVAQRLLDWLPGDTLIVRAPAAAA